MRDEVLRWQPRETAALGCYVLAHVPGRPWSDPDDDPKRVVVKLCRRSADDVRYETAPLYWRSFGPDAFDYDEVARVAALPGVAASDKDCTHIWVRGGYETALGQWLASGPVYCSGCGQRRQVRV